MKVICENSPRPQKGTVVTIGNFDGLHAGHRLLLNTVLEKRHELGMDSLLMSFSPHPLLTLQNRKDFKTITTSCEKKYLLRETGIDIYAEYSFTHSFSGLNPHDFVKTVLLDKLNMLHLVVGQDFKFAKNSSGNVSTLQSLSDTYGFGLTIASEEFIPGINVKISSSLIRELILKKEFDMAASYLTKRFFILTSGKIDAHRRLVFTPDENKLLPPCGKYSTKISIFGKSYSCIINIDEKMAELTVTDINFSYDLYIPEIIIEF